MSELLKGEIREGDFYRQGKMKIFIINIKEFLPK